MLRWFVAAYATLLGFVSTRGTAPDPAQASRSPFQFYARSTPYPRTLQSAAALLQGLFPDLSMAEEQQTRGRDGAKGDTRSGSIVYDGSGELGNAVGGGKAVVFALPKSRGTDIMHGLQLTDWPLPGSRADARLSRGDEVSEFSAVLDGQCSTSLSEQTARIGAFAGWEGNSGAICESVAGTEGGDVGAAAATAAAVNAIPGRAAVIKAVRSVFGALPDDGKVRCDLGYINRGYILFSMCLMCVCFFFINGLVNTVRRFTVHSTLSWSRPALPK
jgi:hypothetical protein